MATQTRLYVFAVGAGFIAAFMIGSGVQAMAPVLAKLPGHFLCDGAFELVVERRSGYGLCDGERVGYWKVLLVSTLLWSLVCIPFALGIAWLRKRRG